MAKKGQKGRNTIEARKVIVNSIAPNIMMFLSWYLRSAPPTRSLKNKDEAPKIPTSTPISAALDPDLAKKIGSVGIRV